MKSEVRSQKAKGQGSFAELVLISAIVVVWVVAAMEGWFGP